MAFLVPDFLSLALTVTSSKLICLSMPVVISIAAVAKQGGVTKGATNGAPRINQKPKNRTAAPRSLVFPPRCPHKEHNPVHVTVMLYSKSGAMISKHMKSGEKALVLFVNHKGHPLWTTATVVYRIRQSLIDFLSMKSKGDADYPATMNALQEHAILFQMNDAQPFFGEPYQAAFFLGVPTHADMEAHTML